ncbi:heme anaerobic degradation radical SAM methyltransferase ChuW/HutW [Afifella pfennigii]|uniref:heme anaerobic degradation radical SAM methyltransferase ChuW/HutW n=1 Tax=Afifella pfennigii TaxID=209897 RepID=UPI0006917E07|nr:heme anaerobic degradation radical SAM methyltransferase ChuW/HutW [Afifella pfennigii]
MQIRPIEEFFAREDGVPLAQAFSASRPVHPSVGMVPIAEAERACTWQALSRRPRQGKSVAYLHIPFCENHCLFCGFYRNAWRPEDGARYLRAVAEHLATDGERPYQAQGPIHALYFGGGTPTALAARDLAHLIEAARQHLPLAPDCEITVEGRAYNFTPDKVEAIFDAGANRVSLGVQSFDTRLRRSLGRKTTREELLRFIDSLILADRGAIVADLIYGLPGQTMEMWERDLRIACALSLDGIDIYSLKLIPGTPLLTAIEKGKFAPTAREALGGYYARAVELLEDARWEAVSTTHWRSTTRERNLYNLLVKGGASCLAFGAGAGGNVHGHSYSITRDVTAFQTAIERSEAPLGHLARQAPHTDLFNRIKGGMERRHLNLPWLKEELRRRAGLNADAVLGPLIGQWQRAGLVEISEDWLDLTVAGSFWQATLTQNLLDWLGQSLRPVGRAVP